MIARRNRNKTRAAPRGRPGERRPNGSVPLIEAKGHRANRAYQDLPDKELLRLIRKVQRSELQPSVLHRLDNLARVANRPVVVYELPPPGPIFIVTSRKRLSGRALIRLVREALANELGRSESVGDSR